MELAPIENPIVIHPHLLQKFLKQGKNYANLLALYSFYLYHAQLQKTNKPLATDEFTRKGMNWASDRVKKTKKILKEMKLIEVVQYKKYYYVHLFFIYTKKKVQEIIGKVIKKTSMDLMNLKPFIPNILIQKNNLKYSETETLSPKKVKIKVEEEVEKVKAKVEIKTESKKSLKPSTPNMSPVLKKWLDYCDKNSIKYAPNNVKRWEKNLDKRISMDKEEAVYKAIGRGWKDFYMTPVKESKYHKFLGKSLMMDRDCDTLLDIGFKDEKFIYQFKNIRVVSATSPFKLFNRHGYDKKEVKNAPIVLKVKEKILGIVKRF